MPQPEVSACALAPLVRPLPAASRSGGQWLCFELDRERLLIVSVGAVDDAAYRQILARFTPRDAVCVSRSSCDGHRAMLVAGDGPAGVDLETLDRVSANARRDDAWLAEPERASVGRSPEPVLELACHWVLKEAYGKALGVGLGMALDGLAFVAEQGAIVLRGTAAPARRSSWRFGLFRRGDALLAVAYR